MVLSASDGRRMVIAAADRAALALGLAPGLPLAQAQARVPSLLVLPATPEADRAALDAFAAWCLRLSPLTAPNPPDGIWIDATGAAHLHGGEAELLEHLTDRLAEDAITCRAAIADTPGAAHALARYGATATTVVPPGGHVAAMNGLPIAALRLEPDLATALRRLGFERVSDLAAAPRAALARRFGAAPGLRLDQAMGRVFEPIEPVFPPDIASARRVFIEPLVTAEAFATVIDDLTAEICTTLERSGQGARRLDLLFERVDGATPRISIGTARPVRAPRHLARLLAERLEQIDPGLGVEAMRLVVPLAEPLEYRQSLATLAADGEPEDDIATLVDRIENRLGRGRVWRAAPVESDVPERSVQHMPALAPGRPDPQRAAWPVHLPRPVRLFDPPHPVEAMALLPDQPPAAFTWRRRRHRVRRADGPERIHGEWWRRDGEMAAVRDYFAVEDQDGSRFWLFRRGNGMDPATGDLSWFLHGVF
jgi:protein ImuB